MSAAQNKQADQQPNWFNVNNGYLGNCRCATGQGQVSMMKTSFQGILLTLLLVFALLRFSDGVSEDDGTALVTMFAFCAAIRLFSGAQNLAEVALWTKRHRGAAMQLLFGVGFVAAGAIGYALSGRVSGVHAAEAIIAANLFFGAIITFATWAKENFFKADE
jgi:cation transport ATPase